MQKRIREDLPRLLAPPAPHFYVQFWLNISIFIRKKGDKGNNLRKQREKETINFGEFKHFRNYL